MAENGEQLYRLALPQCRTWNQQGCCTRRAAGPGRHDQRMGGRAIGGVADQAELIDAARQQIEVEGAINRTPWQPGSDALAAIAMGALRCERLRA